MLFGLCALFATVLAAGNLSESEHKAKAEELGKLRQRISALREELSATRTLHDSVQRMLSDIERKISKHVRSLKRIANKLKTQKRKLTRLQKDKRKQARQLATQQDLLAQQIRTAYMIGRQEYLKLILNQQDPGALGRTMVYYDYFNRARSQQIARVHETLAKIDTLSREINEETAKLTSLKHKRREEKHALEKTYSERALVLARLNREIHSKDEQLTQLTEDEKRLQRLLHAINEAMPDILAETGNRKPFTAYKGKLTWPVRGKVKKLYGKKRKAGKLKWNGVMISAQRGREVYAISHGRVAYADWLRGYGLLLIIDHGDGYMSLYGHNQSLYKETGDWVDINEPIAAVGDSGGQQNAGLYFEIRHNGRPTNPSNWCRRTRRG